MAVTIQKIAELSGVSRGTVDRVLHGRPNVCLLYTSDAADD